MASIPFVFAGGGSQWDNNDKMVYEGQSEIFFTYFGPEGVTAEISQNGKVLGQIDSGTGIKVRKIIDDGEYSYEIRSSVFNPETKANDVDTSSTREINISSKANRVSIQIRIEKQNNRNVVTECNVTETIAITPSIRPQKLDEVGGKIDKGFLNKLIVLHGNLKIH